jgi:molecular chaperone GrpE
MHKKDQKNENQTEQKAACSQCDEYLNGWKRALADYENLKKQTLKEKDEFVKFANANLIIGLLPVYNHFKLSFAHLPENLKDNPEFSGWVKGIEQILKQFKEVLGFNGITEIMPEIGSEFNPAEQEAVENADNTDKNRINTDDADKNKIKKVLSCGYKLNDRVVVAAKVIVE